MDWIQVLVIVGANVAFLLGSIGTTIALFVHGDKKTQEILSGIQQEMKDFHGRLERQDAEFKGKLAQQDAEFKGSILVIEERMKGK